MNSARPVAPSVAERDQQLFDRIATSYARKDLHPASHPARRLRLHQTMATVPLGEEVSLLEVGCGAGFSASYLAGRYRCYTGIDYASELIAFARRYNSNDRATFEVSDLADYEPPERFDVALMIGVLHHFEDPDAMLAKLVKLVVPGGWIVANEPQPANAVIHLLRQVRRRVDRAYSSEQVEFDETALGAAYARAGLAAIRVLPQGLLSTPFAEVPLGPPALTAPLGKLACAADRLLERLLRERLRRVSWNLIAVGRRPSR